MEAAQPELWTPGCSPSSRPASRCGLGTVSVPLWAWGPTWGPGLQPNPTQPHTAAHPGQGQRVGGVEALPPVDVVAMWGVQDGQRDAHPVGGGQQTEKVLLWVPPAAQGPTPPSRKTSRPQDQLHSSAAAAPRCPTCSGHSPDLRRLHQSLRTPLVPRCPAQAAGGARIRRHQKQAPADAVTVHACGAVGSSSSSQPGPQIPGPPPPPHRLVQRDTHRTQTRTCAPGTALSTPPAPAGRTVRPHIAHTLASSHP